MTEEPVREFWAGLYLDAAIDLLYMPLYYRLQMPMPKSTQIFDHNRAIVWVAN
jgi:hypothetical protein